MGGPGDSDAVQVDVSETPSTPLAIRNQLTPK